MIERGFVTRYTNDEPFPLSRKELVKELLGKK
jgi:hypothetical protein